MTPKEREALIIQYQGLPVHILNKLCKAFPAWRRNWDDLLQEGNIGLCVAANKYNAEHPLGASYKTYAYWWVEHYIRAGAQRIENGGFTAIGQQPGRRNTQKVVYEKSLDSEGCITVEGANREERQVSVYHEDAQQHDLSEGSQVSDVVKAKLEEMKERHGERNVTILLRRLLADNNHGVQDAEHSMRIIARDLGMSGQRVAQIARVLLAEFRTWASALKLEHEAV